MNLQQLKTHSKFPFEDIEDDETFLLLEMFWALWFEATLSAEAENWKPKCTAERDGNPILYVHNSEAGRAIRIIHKQNFENKPSYKQDPANGHFPIQAYLGDELSREGKKSGDLLSFFCDCSPDAEQVATRLTRMFCLEMASVDQIEQAISNYEKSIHMPD